jgi:SprT protein
MQKAIKRTIKLAEELYSIDLSELEVRIDVKGLVGGWAVPPQKEGDNYALRFSIEGCEKHPQYMIDDIIPHEVAHIVCFLLYPSASAHGQEWKRICIALGGTAQRCHDLPLTAVRRARTFLYDIEGIAEELTIIRHNKLQRNKVQYYTNLVTGTRIYKEHFVEEV